MGYGKEIEAPSARSTLATMPPAFRNRILAAMAMYREGSARSQVGERHGSIVADEAKTELNRVDPGWWMKAPR